VLPAPTATGSAFQLSIHLVIIAAWVPNTVIRVELANTIDSVRLARNVISATLANDIDIVRQPNQLIGAS
jgi:hypothetical protein